jgi:hypothetical protein
MIYCILIGGGTIGKICPGIPILLHDCCDQSSSPVVPCSEGGKLAADAKHAVHHESLLAWFYLLPLLEDHEGTGRGASTMWGKQE